jgi:hypothetical protein
MRLPIANCQLPIAGCAAGGCADPQLAVELVSSP